MSEKLIRKIGLRKMPLDWNLLMRAIARHHLSIGKSTICRNLKTFQYKILKRGKFNALICDLKKRNRLFLLNLR